MYTTGKQRHFGGGGGVLKFFEGKRGDGKNFWGQDGMMPIFLDAIERLSVYDIIDKPLHRWSFLFASSMKDVFTINALSCNVLYFVQ